MNTERPTPTDVQPKGRSAARERRPQRPMLGALLSKHPAANIILVFTLIQPGCLVVGLPFPNDFRYLSAANIVILLRSIVASSLCRILAMKIWD